MKNKQRELAQFICDYTKSQVDLWRQIPYLALRSDGISGWCGTKSTAYRMGYWRLESGIFNGGYSYTVDLDTGELTRFDKSLDLNIYSTVRQICQIDEYNLNAQAIINRFTEESQEEHRSYTNSAKILENIKEYSYIEKEYRRKGQRPKAYYGYGGE